jgi:type IV pilus assembly protein PilW
MKTMRHTNLHAARGVTLVELLISLVIGAVLIAGAVYIYSQSRRSATVNDTQSRLQENVRYAMSQIEPDIQLAGYYGFSNRPDDFKFISGGSTSTYITASKMQARAADTAIGGVGSTNDCGKNFAVNVIATIDGRNNGYNLDCAPPAGTGGAQDNADMLTIRRASTPPADGLGKEKANRLQVLVSRLSPTNQYVFADGKLPTTPALKANQVQVRDLIVRTYYVSKNSTNPNVAGLPALRVKALADGPAFPDASDTEVMRGVEDFQVQFGIDTGDYDGNGTIDPGRDSNSDGIPDAPNGIATRYVNPNDLLKPNSLPVGFQVVSVRIWLLVRAETPEQGFVNNRRYVYADRDVTVNDSFRRVLMSRTIQLRNTRTL